MTLICSPALSKSRKRRARAEQELQALSALELIERSGAERIELLGSDASALPASLIMRVIEYDVLDPDGKRTPDPAFELHPRY